MKKTSRPTSASRRRSPGPPRRRLATPPVPALAAFAAFASKARLRWYLFGAQAVALYGVQRTSADLDITIDLAGRTFEELEGPLAAMGFSPRFTDRAFAMATRVFPIVHDPTGWPVDLVIAGPGLEQLFLGSVRTHKVARRSIPVLAPEHLIITKLLAQRPKDLEDVRGLLRVATLDHAAILDVLAQLEEALGQRDLRPLYARLRREA